MEAPDVLQRIGDYELLEYVARGGMGVVYRARQTSLNREVAVKVLLDPVFASAEQLARFKAEAAAAGALRHPNIVAIHEIGEAGGQRFFSMDFVAGKDLAELTRDRPLPAREAAHLVLKVADAVHHCHERGILHRDLKPSNVLVDALGEPHVTDFGLAKRMEGAEPRPERPADLTASGQVMGTPGYMSPEQAGAKRDVGPATDIYSLGALLYHLLTGRAPFVGETPTLVLRQVEEQDPVGPRLLNASVPADLETVCLKCLAKEPRHRYATARDLAQDLQRFLDGAPIHARPIGAPKRLWRWSRRRPRVAALIVLSGLLLLLVLGETIYARARLLEDLRVVRRKDYVADMRLVERAIQEDNLGQAASLLDKWDPGTQPARPAGFSASPEDLRGFEWHYFSGLCQGDEQCVLGRHQDRVLRVAFSPHGDRVASASSDGEIRLWDTASHALLGEARLGTRALTVCFSPDDRFLATGGDDQMVRLWNPRNLAPIGSGLHHNSALAVLAFSVSGSNLLAVARQELALWDVGTWTAIRRQALTPSAWFYGSVSPDLSNLALPMPGYVGVRLWNVPAWRDRGFVGELSVATAFSPDNRFLAAGQLDGLLRIWRTSDLHQLISIPTGAGNVRTLAWSPDGYQLASAGRDSALRIWEASTGRLLAIYRGHHGLINWAVFSSDGRSMATASADGTVRLWDPGRPPANRQNPARRDWPSLTGKDGYWPNLRFCDWPGGWSGGGADPTLHVPLPPELRATNVVVGVLSDGFLVFGPGSVLRRFDRTGAPTQPPIELSHGPIIQPLASPNGRWAAWRSSADQLASFSLYRLGARRQLVVEGKPGSPWLLPAFSSDGRFLAMATLRGDLTVWDLEPFRLRAHLEASRGVPTGLSFSRDASRLAVSSAEGRVTVWDNRTPGRRLADLDAGVYPIWCVGFSPDGNRLAGGSDDGDVFVWDMASQQVVAKFKAPVADTISDVTFSPDGNALSAVATSATFIWRVLPPPTTSAHGG